MMPGLNLLRFVPPADLGRSLVLCNGKLKRIFATAFAPKVDRDTIAARAWVAGTTGCWIYRHFATKNLSFHAIRCVLTAVKNRNLRMMKKVGSAPRAKQQRRALAPILRLDLVTVAKVISHG